MSKKIIVIDDSQTVRQQVSVVLVNAGYEVIEAEDGEEGAAAIRANPTAAMAICDVNMPHVGGLEMLESLRDESAPVGCPVLMLTTEGRPDVIERARSSGARGWIVKPFKPTMLLAAVKKIAGEAC
ncbi:MAG: two-component system response regulator [Myxococcales bacterium 68-20]|nr:response regulator [Myxococcales bacterium]OJY22573.1 MAG: two-component system response regulator [Myxococcales bacterium 68-20]